MHRARTKHTALEKKLTKGKGKKKPKKSKASKKARGGKGSGSGGDGPKVRKKYRFRPGTKALREIRKYQKMTKLLIPRSPFQRLTRDVAQEAMNRPMRFKKSALFAIHEAAEQFLVDVFKAANTITLHSKHSTVHRNDMNTALYVRGLLPVGEQPRSLMGKK